MKTNLISQLTTDVHSEEAPRTYCIIINALTAAACSQVMRHLNMVRRGDASPDLDARNNQDERERGEEVVDFLRRASGFNVAQKPLYAAELCDGLRFNLYQDMSAWGEYADNNALYITPAQPITARVNYNQPMSAQLYMQFRIDNAANINPLEVKAAAKRLGITEAVIHESLLREALANKARLIEMKTEIISELQSFNNSVDDAAFDLLDIELRCRIATKIATGYDKQYMRMLPRAIRSLDAASELSMIEDQHKIVKQWLLENDEELQHAMQLRAA